MYEEGERESDKVTTRSVKNARKEMQVGEERKRESERERERERETWEVGR